MKDVSFVETSIYIQGKDGGWTSAPPPAAGREGCYLSMVIVTFNVLEMVLMSGWTASGSSVDYILPESERMVIFWSML